MKKIGILTFHKAFNIGASLQAYSLLKYIQNEICSAELIDFYPNNAIPQRRTFFRNILHLARMIVFYKEYKRDKDKIEAFNIFWNANYKLSADSYFGDDDLKHRILKYDVIISGSDQILNTTLTGSSESFYLKFENKAKKISYASSFGRDHITNIEHALIKSEISKFDCISVREKSAAEIIKNDIGCLPEIVLDPVFLLEKDQWKSCAKLRKCSKYVLVYAMETTPYLIKAIKYAESVYQFPIITICANKKCKSLPGEKKYSCGPSEFLSLLSNAEIVVTNSFHGVAFSFIFGKKIIVVSHSLGNTRIENIMSLSGQTSKIVYENTVLSDGFVVDGEYAYNKLNDLRRTSKEYLKRCL